MKNFSRQFAFLGLAMCIGAASALAEDSKVYDFDGWKVTITPGRSAAKPARPLPALKTDPAPVKVPADAAQKRPRTVVQPISLQETGEKPDDVKASPKASSASPSETPFVLPPSPPAENASTAESDDGALPVITPRSPDTAPFPNPQVMPVQTALYRDIYFSIPFNRAEYNAYPSYRHDATMELLFNQMRNTVIQRGTTNVYQYDMGYNGFRGYNGNIGPYHQYYPFTYGLRIHSSR